jgi:AcrR family transcriptional regulator
MSSKTDTIVSLPVERSSASSRRKRSILKGAVRLFLQRGYHGTSIRDIGAAAGVTSAALYRHFANKDAVLETALWEFARHVAEASRNVVEQEGQSPRESLQALVRAFAEAALQERDFLAAYLFEARNLRTEVFAEMQRSEREYRDMWMHHLRVARPELSETAARAMVRAALLMVAHGCLEDPELDTGRLADLLAGMAVTAMLGAG